MMRIRGVFSGYYEAPVLFRPTYVSFCAVVEPSKAELTFHGLQKYDNGTQTYDSSEKQRIPAYTDRILYAGYDASSSYSCRPASTDASALDRLTSRGTSEPSLWPPIIDQVRWSVSSRHSHR